MCLQMPHESTVAHEHEQRLSKEDNAASAAATLKSVSETVLNASKNAAATTTVDEASSESFTLFYRLSPSHERNCRAGPFHPSYPRTPLKTIEKIQRSKPFNSAG